MAAPAELSTAKLLQKHQQLQPAHPVQNTVERQIASTRPQALPTAVAGTAGPHRTVLVPGLAG